MRGIGAALICVLASWLLAACSVAPVPVSQPPAAVVQHPAPGGPPGELGVYTASQGASLAYVSYRQPGATTALVYLHGIESHAGWFAIAADALRDQGYDVYCLDRRGSGLNREDRGFVSGYVDDYATLLSDIDAFVAPLRERYQNVFLVGLSWGGKLALSYGLAHPHAVDGLVLITPGLRARVDVSLMQKLKIALLSPLNPGARVALPIRPEMFTTTPVYLDYIRNDPLRLSSATVRFLWQSHRLDGYVDRNISDNRLPIQLFLAGGDTIIDNEGVVELLQRGSAGGLAVQRYEDQTHSVQMDAARRLSDDMTAWLRAQETALRAQMPVGVRLPLRPENGGAPCHWLAN
jgi:alpha-beta hydrolase superfamily lysophospholipase